MILGYDKFFERQGISDDLEKLNDYVLTKVNIDFKSKEYIIDNFKSSLNNKRPISLNNLKINFKYYKHYENICNAITKINNVTYNDDTLENIEIELNIYYIDENNEEFIFYIKSVLFHELTHVYQLMQLYNSNKFKPSSWSISNLIPAFRKFMKSNYIQDLIEILYLSLDHEIYAQVHQYYLYRKSNMNYDKIFDIIDKLENFEIKSLTKLDEIELNKIKEYVLNSLKNDKNTSYIINVDNSFWNEGVNSIFLIELKNHFKMKSNLLLKKIKRIDNRLNSDIDTELNSIIENKNYYRTTYENEGSELDFLFKLFIE